MRDRDEIKRRLEGVLAESHAIRADEVPSDQPTKRLNELVQEMMNLQELLAAADGSAIS
jgi:hypothetical protein